MFEEKERELGAKQCILPLEIENAGERNHPLGLQKECRTVGALMSAH